MYKLPSDTSCSSTTKTVYSAIEWGSKFRKNAKQKQEESENKCGVKKKKPKPFNPCAKLDDLFAALNAGGKKQYADPFKVIKIEEKRACISKICNPKKGKNKNGKKKVKIVNRDTLTRRQHIELLSRPRTLPQDVTKKPDICKKRKKCHCQKSLGETATPNMCNKKKKKKKCMCISPKDTNKVGKGKKKKKCNGRDDVHLSPRLRQLAMPTKRLVYANWAAYKDVLDPGTVERMQNILVAETGQNLEPCEADRYFKAKDRKKRKPKVTKMQKRKEQAEKKWLTNEINILADYIVHDIAKNPLIAENNRHIQLTNSLITTLRFKGYKVEQISRKTKNIRKRATLQIFDHISVWSDQIFQRAEILELEVNVRRYEKMLEKYRAQATEESQSAKPEEQIKSSLDVFYELSYAEEQDIIETLIKVLKSGDDNTLDLSMPHHPFSDVTYRQLLEKLEGLRGNNMVNVDLLNRPVESLKHELMKWTKKRRSKKLSDELTKAVKEVSHCLLKYFKPEKGPFFGPNSKRQSAKAAILHSSEEILRSMSENIDLSDIPTYRDPNEDYDEDETIAEDADEYDRSLFAGNTDDVVHSVGLYEREEEDG